jgi:phage portal protein BeeE
MKKFTGLHLMLTGEAFWLLDGRLGIGRAPTRIDLLLSEYVRTKSNKLGDLVEYGYELPDGRKTFAPEDVVHFRMPDPSRWERGHAPTQAIRYPIDTHKEADVLNLKRLMNGAVRGGLLNPKQALIEGQIKTLREQWNALHQGAQNAGRMAVMPTNIEFKEVQQTNQEMRNCPVNSRLAASVSL